MTPLESLHPILHRVQRRALLIGIIGALAMASGAWYSPERFYPSYLFGYAFWIGLSLGCLAVLMLHHLVSGAWGFVIQRVTEAGVRTLPFMALMFIPLYFGIDRIYPWTDATLVAESHVLHQKSVYLNVPFFLVRTVFYFAFWIAAALLLSKWSRTQDRTGEKGLTKSMKVFSGPGMAVLILTVTFASIDWMMSLEPEWFSSIYGAMIIVGDVLGALSLAIILIRFLALRKPLVEILTPRHYHHLGNMLLAFTILWAYMAFSQLLITWSGNLPEDSSWYLRRITPGWSTVAILLIVGHFFIPFILLLLRRTKKVIRSLSLVAGGILVMRVVDVFWLIRPAFSPESVSISALDVITPIGIGALWVAVFVSQLKGHSLVPLHDPRFTPILEQAKLTS
jgi:hypothetical protein